TLPDPAATSVAASDRCALGKPPPEERQTASSRPHVCHLLSSRLACSSLLSCSGRRSFHIGQHLVQSVVILLQSFSKHFQPLVHCFNTRLRQPSRTPGSIHAAHHESRIFERL